MKTTLHLLWLSSVLSLADQGKPTSTSAPPPPSVSVWVWFIVGSGLVLVLVVVLLVLLVKLCRRTTGKPTSAPSPGLSSSPLVFVWVCIIVASVLILVLVVFLLVLFVNYCMRTTVNDRVPTSEAPPPASERPLALALLCHLVVLCPYVVSTVLMVSLYRGTLSGEGRGSEAPPTQTEPGLDEDYDDVMAVTTELQF